MAKKTHHETGLQGEDIALKHLRARGLVLLHRRWRHGSFDELDLILDDPARGEQVIVEVKTLTAHPQSERRPEDALTAAKRKSLRRAAEAYCALEQVTVAVRIDVVAVMLSAAGELLGLEHFEDVRLD